MKTKFTVDDSITFNAIGDVCFNNNGFAYSLYHYRDNALTSDIYYKDKLILDASLPYISNNKLYYLKNTVHKTIPSNLPYYLVEQHYIKRQIYCNNRKVTNNNLDIFDYKVNDKNILYKAYQYTEDININNYQNKPLVFDTPSFYSDKEYGFKAKRKILYYFNDTLIDIKGNIVDFLFIKDVYVLLYTSNGAFFVEVFDFNSESKLKIKLDKYLPSFVGFSTIYYEKENALIFTMNRINDQYNDPKNLYLLRLEKNSKPIPLISMKYLQDGVQLEAYNLPSKAIHTSTYIIYKDELYFISSKNGTNALYKTAIKRCAIPTLVDDSKNYIHLYVDKDNLYSLISNNNIHSLLIQQNNGLVLVDPNPALKQKQFANFEVINIVGRDNQQLQSFYYYPSNINKKIPLIVLIHGGPNGFYSSGFNYEAQLYVSLGYGVILPNPRGGSGFGKKHGNMNYAFNDSALHDIEDITKYVLDKYDYLDSSRVAITGGSYGGYESIYAAIHSNMYKVAVSLRPLISFQMTGSCSGSAGTSPSDKSKPFEKYLKDNIKASLSTYVEKINIPIQIMHSTLDANCLPEASIQLFSLLDFYKPDLPKRLCLYPNSNHGLLSYGPANLVKQVYLDILEWFDLYL